MRIAPSPSFKVSVLVVLAFLSIPSIANEIVSNNPFDPNRKPWIPVKEAPPPPPPLPDLTPKDLQIDAILVFGQFRGIIAQLDGQLKGALPANAVGKVRIQIGQNFGAGYTLASVEPNHVVVQTGDKRFVVPVLRKINRGGSPAPSQAPVATTASPPETQTLAPPAAIPAPQTAQQTSSTPSPPEPPAAAQDASQAQSQSAPPMSLLDAIRQAQEAAKSRSGNNQAPASPGTPFFGIGR